MITRRGAIASSIVGGLGSLLDRTRGTSAADEATKKPKKKNKSNKPNIILIVTDDQDAASLSYMSNVQQLASSGLTLQNFFATTPICCPSRASIFRGQYSHNHTVRYNFAPGGAFSQFLSKDLGDNSVFSWMADAGYRTGCYGKFLNGYPDKVSPTWKPKGVTDFAVVKSGHHINFKLNQNGKSVTYKGQKNYMTKVLANLAIKEMSNSKKKKQPFFLYIAPQAVHSPLIPETKYVGRYSGAEAPRVPSFGEANTSDKPAWVQAWPVLDQDRTAAIDANYQQRLELLASVDAMVGQLRRALDKNKQANNTYIIFTTDNGWLAGAHNLEGKQSAYTESIQLPTVVWGPKVRKGETDASVLLNIDLAPTIADLGGAKLPPYVDGRSFKTRLISENAPEVRNSALIEYWKFPGNPPGGDEDADVMSVRGLGGTNYGLPPTYKALRSTSELYVEYPDTGEFEYYDLTADPDQLKNIYDTLDGDTKQSLTDRLAALGKCKQRTCQTAETA